MVTNPKLYEINTAIFLRRLSAKYGRRVTLGNVPFEEWQALARRGFNAVWLMGVWQRSAAGRSKALCHTGLCQEYDRVLPGWTEKDVGGSPYAICSYTIDPSLGEAGDLARLKSEVNRHGMALILDFIPNHFACDHAWTLQHPDWFVHAGKNELQAHPDWFFPAGPGIYIAHGRDPYWGPWTDTSQVNFFSPGMRQAMTGELLRVAEVADGVRCDVAMLGLNDVFAWVWGDYIKRIPRPQTEFWTDAIKRVKKEHPGFLFIAEAYWGYERKLQELGFDFTYDKALYDRLRDSPARDIRAYLATDEAYHHCAVHFIENHDEARAATAFGNGRALAAAAVVATIPGIWLCHDGQLEGCRTHLPVQLVREPQEEAVCEVVQFYEKLLPACQSSALRSGDWTLLDVGRGGEGKDNSGNILAWLRRKDTQASIIVINYAAEAAQVWVQLPSVPSSLKGTALQDSLGGPGATIVTRDGDGPGIYLELAPYEVRILSAISG